MLSLLDDDRAFVRVGVAFACLPVDEDRAVAVLEELAHNDDGFPGFEAKWGLRSWRQKKAGPGGTEDQRAPTRRATWNIVSACCCGSIMIAPAAPTCACQYR